jgi:hypothetical protein
MEVVARASKAEVLSAPSGMVSATCRGALPVPLPRQPAGDQGQEDILQDLDTLLAHGFADWRLVVQDGVLLSSMTTHR